MDTDIANQEDNQSSISGGVHAMSPAPSQGRAKLRTSCPRLNRSSSMPMLSVTSDNFDTNTSNFTEGSRSIVTPINATSSNGQESDCISDDGFDYSSHNNSLNGRRSKAIRDFSVSYCCDRRECIEAWGQSAIKPHLRRRNAFEHKERIQMQCRSCQDWNEVEIFY